MSLVKYAGGKRYLRAYIAVCLQIHCNPTRLFTFIHFSFSVSATYDAKIKGFVRAWSHWVILVKNESIVNSGI